MVKLRTVLLDVSIFGVIALVAALFAFSATGSTAEIVGRIVFCISLVLVGLAFVVKRPPQR